MTLDPIKLMHSANAATLDALAFRRAGSHGLARIRRNDARRLREMASEQIRKQLPNPNLGFRVHHRDYFDRTRTMDMRESLVAHADLLAAGYTWDGMDGYAAPDTIRTTAELTVSLERLGWGAGANERYRK